MQVIYMDKCPVVVCYVQYARTHAKDTFCVHVGVPACIYVIGFQKSMSDDFVILQCYAFLRQAGSASRLRRRFPEGRVHLHVPQVMVSQKSFDVVFVNLGCVESDKSHTCSCNLQGV
jgi:hypothetical protein